MACSRRARSRVWVATLFVLASSELPAQRASRDTTRPTFVPLGHEAALPLLSTPVTVASEGTPFLEVVRDIARQAKVGVSYASGLPGLRTPVTLRLSNVTAREALQRACNDAPITVLVASSGQIVLVRRPASPRPERGIVRGLVLDAGGSPLAGARIDVGPGAHTANSGTDGAFVLRGLAPTTYSGRARRVGYEAADLPPIQVDSEGVGGTPAAETAPIIVVMQAAPPTLATVLVSPGSYALGGRVQDATQMLSADEIRFRPQLGEDLFRSVNRLPGLSSNDYAAGFHVRGAELDETYVALDGIQLHEPFHLKDVEGLLSIIDINLADDIELKTGGFTADRGGRLGGVLAIRSIDPTIRDGQTAVGLSVGNVRLGSQGSFADGQGGWVIAARRGYLDLALRLAGVADSVSPRYGDLFAKVTRAVGSANRVTAELLWSTDGFDYRSTTGEVSSGYGNSYAWLTWETSPATSLRGRTSVAATRVGWRRAGRANEDFNVSGEIREDRRFSATTLSTDWSWREDLPLSIRWGGFIEPARASYVEHASRTTPRVLGDSAAFTVDDIDATLAPAGRSGAGYVTSRIQPLAWLSAETGVRFERSTYSGDATLSPRFNALARLTGSTTLRFADGRYVQSQPLYSLQVLDGATNFGHADLSEQRVVSLEQRVGERTTARVELYERRVTRERPRYIDLQANTNAFPELAPDRVFLNATRGRAKGLELSAQRRDDARLSWMASYAFASATDEVDGLNVPRTYDQRHTAYVDASFRPRASGWQLSGAWQMHSGWPAAPVRFRLDTIGTGAQPKSVLQATFGPVARLGDERLLWYHRVDLRATREFDTRHGQIAVYADVFNLFGSSNPRAYMYAGFVTDGRLTVTRSVDPQFGRIPSAGVSWTF